IAQYQPVGRRSLSEYMDLTERVLRSETDVLKKQALIKVNPQVWKSLKLVKRQYANSIVILTFIQMIITLLKLSKKNMALKMFMSFLVIQTLIKRLKLNYLNKPDS